MLRARSTLSVMAAHSTGQPTTASGVSVDAVVAELRALRDDVRQAVGEEAPGRGGASVDNMRAYLALRRHDNRELQAALARLGLSSLGRSEGHVLATLEQVLGIVERLAADAPTAADSFDESSALLGRRVTALFGDGQAGRRTRIMVTLPSEAAPDADLIASLVTAGMDCARINSAHDDAAAWTAMAWRVRAASESAGRRVPILVDLPGPKLRTGADRAGSRGRPPSSAPRRARRDHRPCSGVARRSGVGSRAGRRQRPRCEPTPTASSRRGLILKIETRAGFDALPELLREALALRLRAAS
jgi:hypothetical protein